MQQVYSCREICSNRSRKRESPGGRPPTGDREFALAVATCTPAAIAVGAVFGLAVFTYAVAHEKTHDHPVAVGGPAGGPSEIARG
jgi:hypothetical protein